MPIDANKLDDGDRVFLAEGYSEQGLIKAIFDHLQIRNAKVFNVEGEANLRASLLTLVGKVKAGTTLGCLGLVFDANDDYGARIMGIQTALQNVGLQFDKDRLDANLVFRHGDFPIGVFLSPGRQRPGRIEVMVLEEFGSRPITTCINSLVACVRNRSGGAVTLSEKARTHAYLAALNQAAGLGTAFQKGLMDLNHAAYAEVLAMIGSLARDN